MAGNNVLDTGNDTTNEKPLAGSVGNYTTVNESAENNRGLFSVRNAIIALSAVLLAAVVIVTFYRKRASIWE